MNLRRAHAATLALPPEAKHAHQPPPRHPCAACSPRGQILYGAALEYARSERYEIARRVFAKTVSECPAFLKPWVSWAQVRGRSRSGAACRGRDALRVPARSWEPACALGREAPCVAASHTTAPHAPTLPVRPPPFPPLLPQMEKRCGIPRGDERRFEACRSVLQRGLAVNRDAPLLLQAWGLMEMQVRGGRGEKQMKRGEMCGHDASGRGAQPAAV